MPSASLSWAHRLQPSSHSDGGEAEAEPRQHDGGGRYAVPTSCVESSLPRPHTAGLDISIDYVSRFM
jgi:hypothetical protein